MLVTSERNTLKELTTELKSSIEVYKEMLIDRDSKLKELTDKIQEHQSGASLDNNSYEGIMLTLNQNAHLIKSLATSKNKNNQSDPKTVSELQAVNAKYKELDDMNKRLLFDNKELLEKDNQNKIMITEMDKMIKIKNKYLEVRMQNEEVEDAQSMLSTKLAVKAGEKIKELRNTLDMLLKSKEKDHRFFILQ